MHSNLTEEVVLSKQHLLRVIRSRGQGTSAHCISALELPRKTRCSQALDEWRGEEISSSVSISLPRLADPSQQPTQSIWPAQTPPILPQEAPSFHTGDRCTGELATCLHFTNTSAKQRMHIESDTGKDIPPQGDKSRTDSECSLSLDKKSDCSRLTDHSYSAKRELKDCPVCIRLPFPTFRNITGEWSLNTTPCNLVLGSLQQVWGGG